MGPQVLWKGAVLTGENGGVFLGQHREKCIVGVSHHLHTSRFALADGCAFERSQLSTVVLFGHKGWGPVLQWQRRQVLGVRRLRGGGGGSGGSGGGGGGDRIRCHFCLFDHDVQGHEYAGGDTETISLGKIRSQSSLNAFLYDCFGDQTIQWNGKNQCVGRNIASGKQSPARHGGGIDVDA